MLRATGPSHALIFCKQQCYLSLFVSLSVVLKAAHFPAFLGHAALHLQMRSRSSAAQCTVSSDLILSCLVHGFSPNFPVSFFWWSNLSHWTSIYLFSSLQNPLTLRLFHQSTSHDNCYQPYPLQLWYVHCATTHLTEPKSTLWYSRTWLAFIDTATFPSRTNYIMSTSSTEQPAALWPHEARQS